mgnify:CR=1 FL=1
MIKTDAKTILADSIKELLKERSFLNIGVQDIVKNCDVSRTAFYNHFKDKYDLVSWIYRRDVEDIYWKLKKFDWKISYKDFAIYAGREGVLCKCCSL